MGLLASYREETAGTAGDHPPPQRRTPSSARRRAAQERRPFLLALAGFAHPQRPPASPALLGNARVPGSRSCAPRPVPRECSRPHAELLQEKPVPSGIGPSNLVASDRSEPLQRVHSRIQLPFWIGS